MPEAQTPPADALSRPEGPSRRGFVLAALGAVAAAGGGGALAAAVRSRPAPPPEPAPESPAVLVAAARAEAHLIAAIDATGDPQALAHLRADHVAHLQALLGAAGVVQGGSAIATPVVPKSPPMTLDQLRATESAAAKAAVAAASALTGADAALLASIAACEATHAELLR